MKTVLLICLLITSCATNSDIPYDPTKVHGIKVVVPFKPLGALGVAAYPFVFIQEKYADDKNMINHENIHMAQYREMLIIGFPITYLYQYIKWALSDFKDHFRFYSALEREAYHNAHNLNYLATRKSFAWLKY